MSQLPSPERTIPTAPVFDALNAWLTYKNQCIGIVEVGWGPTSGIPKALSDIEAVWESGAVPIVTWMPYPYIHWTSPTPNADIVSGVYDGFRRRFAVSWMDTNSACGCLTSQIGRDVVLSAKCGRTQRCGRAARAGPAKGRLPTSRHPTRTSQAGARDPSRGTKMTRAPSEGPNAEARKSCKPPRRPGGHGGIGASTADRREERGKSQPTTSAARLLLDKKSAPLPTG